jgi:hypothetical protein
MAGTAPVLAPPEHLFSSSLKGWQATAVGKAGMQSNSGRQSWDGRPESISGRASSAGLPRGAKPDHAAARNPSSADDRACRAHDQHLARRTHLSRSFSSFSARFSISKLLMYAFLRWRLLGRAGASSGGW